MHASSTARVALVLVLLSAAAVSASAVAARAGDTSFPYPYTFADRFTLEQLLNDGAARDSFRALAFERDGYGGRWL
jgi:hypothetical protein